VTPTRTLMTVGRPAPTESPEYHKRYIEQVRGADVLATLVVQREAALAQLGSIAEHESMHRYAPGKWSAREVLAHVNDTERVFTFRAFWFARGFDSPLPSFDQDVAAASTDAHGRSWASHVAEFRAVRDASVMFFSALEEEAWSRVGEASGHPFTVRALAYIVAGHVEHHLTSLSERYFPR
jgi:hypothetical protein